MLAELVRLGRTGRGTQAVVDLACERAYHLVGSDFVALLLRGQSGLSWIGTAGTRSEAFQDHTRTVGRGPGASAISEGRTVILRRADPDGEGLFAGLQAMQTEGTETIMAVPLKSPAGAFASLVFGWRSDHQPYTEQRALAERVSDYVATVLDNTLAHTESERRRIEAESLAELVRRGAMERDPAVVIDLICEEASKLTGADYAGVRLVDETGRLDWRGMWGNRTDAWRQHRPASGSGSSSQALAAGRTVISRVADLAAAGRPLDPASVRAREGGEVELGTP